MLFHPERLTGLQLNVANCALAIAAAIKKQLDRDTFIVFGYRSNDDQQKLYEQGRTLQNGEWAVTDVTKIVTNAPPGLSAHNYNCAVDLWVMKADNSDIDWDNIYAKSIIGNTARQYDTILWGGDYTGSFKDIDHIEFKEWQQVKDGTLTIQTYPPQEAAS
jgi:hypothetical protein